MQYATSENYTHETCAFEIKVLCMEDEEEKSQVNFNDSHSPLNISIEKENNEIVMRKVMKIKLNFVINGMEGSVA